MVRALLGLVVVVVLAGAGVFVYQSYTGDGFCCGQDESTAATGSCCESAAPVKSCCSESTETAACQSDKPADGKGCEGKCGEGGNCCQGKPDGAAKSEKP